MPIASLCTCDGNLHWETEIVPQCALIIVRTSNSGGVTVSGSGWGPVHIIPGTAIASSGGYIGFDTAFPKISDGQFPCGSGNTSSGVSFKFSGTGLEDCTDPNRALHLECLPAPKIRPKGVCFANC